MAQRPSEPSTHQADRNAPATDLDDRLKRLGTKLDTRRQKEEAEELRAERGSSAGLGQALRLSSEFIAAILVGVGLGWMADKWLGTSPWGLIVFLMLGFGAGILNILRATGQVAEFGAVRSAGEPESGAERTDESGDGPEAR